MLVSVSRVSCQVTESGRAVPGPRSGATLRGRAWVSALRGFGLGRAACHSCRRGLNRRVLCSHMAGRKGGGGGGVRESLQLPGQSWPFPLVVSAPEEEPELKPSLPFPPRLLVPGQNESPSRTCCAPSRGERTSPASVWPRGPEPRRRVGVSHRPPITWPTGTARFRRVPPSQTSQRGAGHGRTSPAGRSSSSERCPVSRGEPLRSVGFKGVSVIAVSPPSSSVLYANCFKVEEPIASVRPSPPRSEAFCRPGLRC